MKRITTILISLFLLAPAALLAGNPDWNGKYTKEKKIKKEFSVTPNALLRVSNSYGNLYITTWNENRTVIEVHIKTNSNSEDKAQKKLDEITVNFESSTSEVSAKTIFEKEGWGWSWNSGKVSMEINYTIKLPVGNRVNLNNDYGAIYLDKLNGKAEISCDYGRMEIGSLNAADNVLRFDYTSKTEIGYIKGGEIRADYSGYEIQQAGSLNISADYTNSVIHQAERLEYNCDYGSITLDQISGNLIGRGDYLTTKIGMVNGDVNLNSDYGSIRIDELGKGAGNVDIQSDYTSIKIGYNSGYAFDFEIKLNYADLNGKGDLKMEVSREKSADRYFKGYHGSKGQNRLNISSNYGGVNLTKTN